MAEQTHNVNLDEHNEPQSGASQMPVGIMILLILAGYFGCYEVDKNNANFSAMVHAPFTEPDEVASLAPSEMELMRSQGRTLYANCQGCHQANGMGTPGKIPPLAGSEWVRGNPETIAAIVLNGLSGPLKVAGKSFGAEAMTPFGPALKDEEIAAVITFVRNEWGNTPDAPLEPKAMIQLITDTRKKIEASGHTGAWTKELLDANEFTTPE